MSTTPANWYPDTTGRHQLRYWDGTRWTEHVSDNGVSGVDPLDGQAPAQGTRLDRVDGALTIGNEGDPARIQQQLTGDGLPRRATCRVPRSPAAARSSPSRSSS
jgi:hypothetical protein